MYNLNSRAFTLVELIVVITILAILGTIGFISLQGYGLTARDAVRISDLNSIIKVIELYKLEEGDYPSVSNPINVTFSGAVIWKQGSFGEDTRRFAKRISEVPIDPLTFNEFAYSRTMSTGEYEVGSIVEKKESIPQISLLINESYAAENILKNYATTIIKGNYNGKFIVHKEGDSIYILGVPTILAGYQTGVTLEEIHINQGFVYEGSASAPATYSGAVVNQGGWNFTPTNTSGNIEIIHQTTVDNLNTGTGKLDFIKNIKSYYAFTDVAKNGKYKELLTLDPISNPNEAIDLANTYIQTEVGGLSGNYLLVSEGSSSDINSSFLHVAHNGGDVFSAMNNYGGYYNSLAVSNAYAFAGLRSDGSIEAWGSDVYGGLGEPTGTGFVKIYSTKWAFTGLKSDGSIESWGHFIYGGVGEPTGTGFVDIFSTERAFAGLKSDGSIEAWGDNIYGGLGEPTGTGFVNIYSTQRAFAGLKSDGSIEAWGDDVYGGLGEPTGIGFVKIYSNYVAFAGLKSDGSIEAWGLVNQGGNNEPLGTGFTKIYSTRSAFAVINADTSIYTWGSSTTGAGPDTPTGTGFVKIYSADQAFTGLKEDGSIQSWGNDNYGGNENASPTGTGFVKIFSNIGAFAGLKEDGSIQSWGNDNYGGNENASPIGNGFVNIFSTDRAFAGLKVGGRIDAWGYNTYGGLGEPIGTGFISINGR